MKQRVAWLQTGLLVSLVAAGCGAIDKAEDHAPTAAELHFAADYLDRARIQEDQTTRAPRIIGHILHPTLGFPERLEPGASFTAFVARDPAKLNFYLVPRASIEAAIRSTSYALPAFDSDKDDEPVVEFRRTIDACFVGDVSTATNAIPLDAPKVARAALAQLKKDSPHHRLIPALEAWVADRPRADLPGYRPRLLAWRSRLYNRLWRELQPLFRAKHTAMVVDHQEESFASLEGAVSKIRDSVGSAVKNGNKLKLRRVGAPKSVPGRKRVWSVALSPAPGVPVPNGLYALALCGDKDSLEDCQINAVYMTPHASSEDAFHFVVAADLQWGTKARVSSSVLRFVRTMNELVALGDAEKRTEKPEFAVLVGDIVDCSYGSAESDSATIFSADSGPLGYSHDFYQAWLALAALDLPAYILPGNHDGYRFDLPFWKKIPVLDWLLGGYSGDGLLLFESTFGPRYFAFDRGKYRFICANSYDLPDDSRTLHDLTKLKIETLARKANKLNWGGTIRTEQRDWIRNELGLLGSGAARAPDAQNRFPLIFMHHDPRASMPALHPNKHVPGMSDWSVHRHFPVTGWTDGRARIDNLFDIYSEARKGWAPRFSETTEMHEGFYTPFRRPDSDIGVEQWFEQWPRPPAGGAYPGWIRYQQVWHMDLVYTGDLESTSDFDVVPPGDGVVTPLELLRTIVDGHVRGMFEGHDNLFCVVPRHKGRNIFSEATVGDLELWARQSTMGPKALEAVHGLVMDDDMWVYHTADVGDAESDGHGYLWVKADKDGVVASERDLPLGVAGEFEGD